MLGRVRKPTVSSLEQLEMERGPSKIVNNNSLSVYGTVFSIDFLFFLLILLISFLAESTLLKLREGSRNMTPSTEMETDGAPPTACGGEDSSGNRSMCILRYLSSYRASSSRFHTDDEVSSSSSA
ncbi:hypothetical protein M569_12747 [Genlisea aurea]|uniref:Uncharacterized protein n=1 Tax=Genlisea aurea TaxID=192259 RepID=S8DGV3_9LAMI|nr:hypothetical protein M569_12747 [Genlisea aurea]